MFKFRELAHMTYQGIEYHGDACEIYMYAQCTTSEES